MGPAAPDVSDEREGAGTGPQPDTSRNTQATDDPGPPPAMDEGCAVTEMCGELCGPCARDTSCEECPLRLVVAEREDKDGSLRSFVLALDFDAAPEAPLPTMADIQLGVDGPARITEVELLEPLTEAGKDAVTDPDTGLPYREIEEDRFQILLLSTASNETISAGRWLRLRFLAGGFSGPPTRPIVVRLLKREQIFAPPPADALLWGSPIDQPVVLRPEQEISP